MNRKLDEVENKLNHFRNGAGFMTLLRRNTVFEGNGEFLTYRFTQYALGNDKGCQIWFRIWARDKGEKTEYEMEFPFMTITLYSIKEVFHFFYRFCMKKNRTPEIINWGEDNKLSR